MIDRALGFLRQRGVNLDLAKVTYDDEATYTLMQSGQTLGVFQLEGQGMRDTLRKVRPTTLDDIIALISLYRPGPMKNIDHYAAVKHGIEEPNYLHPTLEPILKETYGVIIYQEQVMQIAQVLSGYSLGEADLLRRAMGKKQPAEMAKQKSRFIQGAKERDVEEDRASHIFDLVEEFAGYGFNKSHAAAYAVIAYPTGYLKANYPVEFMAASMSLDAGNTDKLAIFRQEAQRTGMKMLPPDINASGADFTVEGESVRYALGAVKNVGMAAMAEVVKEREKNGRYKDIFDFAERLDPKAINKRQLENLARAGAFDTLLPDRARAFAACDTVAALAVRTAEEKASAQASLFGGGEKLARPQLPKVHPWSAEERLDNERDSVGFYLSGHPLDKFLAQAPQGKYATFAAVHDEGEVEPRTYAMTGVMRKIREITTKDGARFAFVAFSDPTGEFETMVLGENMAQARDVLVPGKAYVFRARARWRDSELRFTGDLFEPLEAAEARASSGADLKIVLQEGGSASFASLAETLKALKAASAAGDARALRLILKLADGREVEVQPKGLYPAGPQARAALKAARGVERVM